MYRLNERLGVRPTGSELCVVRRLSRDDDADRGGDMREMRAPLTHHALALWHERMS